MYMKVCTHAFDPSLALVIVSYYTTYNVCIVIHMYVLEMLQTSLRLYVSTYVAATIHLLRALTVGVHSTDVLFE